MRGQGARSAAAEMIANNELWQRHGDGKLSLARRGGRASPKLGLLLARSTDAAVGARSLRGSSFLRNRTAADKATTP